MRIWVPEINLGTFKQMLVLCGLGLKDWYRFRLLDLFGLLVSSKAGFPFLEAVAGQAFYGSGQENWTSELDKRTGHPDWTTERDKRTGLFNWTVGLDN